MSPSDPVTREELDAVREEQVKQAAMWAVLFTMGYLFFKYKPWK